MGSMNRILAGGNALKAWGLTRSMNGAVRGVLLDHLVRPEQHGLRNCQADLLGSFKINHQLELRRLLDGEVGGLGAFEDFVDVSGGTAGPVEGVRSNRQ